MSCYKHTDRESVSNCSLCGESICGECLVEIAGRPYCKDCVDKIVTQSILDKVSQNTEDNTQEQSLQEEPIQQPEVETITPLKPEEIEKEVQATVEEVPQAISPKIEKAPENFETDVEYETEYVETYDEGGEEDTYYENPEPIPEPKPEKYSLQSEPIVINPVNKEKEVPEDVATPENIQTPKQDYIQTPEQIAQDFVANLEYDQKPEVAPEYAQTPNRATANVPNPELEAKYERYLEDLYYDEPEAQINEQYREPIRQRGYREPIREEEYLQAPYQEVPQQNIRNQGQYMQRPPRENFENQGQYYINQDNGEELIVPAHSQQNPQQATESYEDLKRRIEMNYAAAQEENKKGLFRKSKKSKKQKAEQDYGDMYNIQEMHGFKEESDDGFTITEILLTIILIILIIVVILYVIYLFTLSGDYLSFFDAIIGLFQDPSTFFNNIIN